MLSLPPYNSWPLQVKLFHPEAVEEWARAAKNVPDSQLPPGLQVSTELEGVDGKYPQLILGTALSKQPRTARTTPIDVKDGVFGPFSLLNYNTRYISKAES